MVFRDTFCTAAPFAGKNLCKWRRTLRSKICLMKQVQPPLLLEKIYVSGGALGFLRYAG